MISKVLLKILICPKCKSSLEHNKNELACNKCKKEYEIKNNIPIFPS